MSGISGSLTGSAIRELSREIMYREVPDEFCDLLNIAPYELKSLWEEVIDNIRHHLAQKRKENKPLYRERFYGIIEQSFNEVEFDREEFTTSEIDADKAVKFLQSYFINVYDSINSAVAKKEPSVTSSNGQTYVDPAYLSGFYLEKFLYYMEGSKFAPLREFAADIKNKGLTELKLNEIDRYFTTLEHSNVREVFIRESSMWFRQSLKTSDISVDGDLRDRYIANITNPALFAEYYVGLALAGRCNQEEMKTLSESCWKAVSSVAKAIEGTNNLNIGLLTFQTEVAMREVNEEIIKLGKGLNIGFSLQVKNDCFSCLHSQFVECLQSAGKDDFTRSHNKEMFEGFAVRYLGAKSAQASDLGLSS